VSTVTKLGMQPAMAVILFVEQTNSIIAKNGCSLFIASIVILFLRIDEQIAEIAIFLFVYLF